MRITLKTDATQIKVGILKATRSGINAGLHKAADGVKRDISDMISLALSSSEAYNSLMSGLLRAELGLEDPEPKLREILNVLKNAVEVSVVPVQNLGNSLRGGLTIKIIKSNFEDILSLSSASYQGKNFPIPWLDWLLLQGDRIIVSTHHITYDLSQAQKSNSQTGVAIMEKGGGWRVPPAFAGTIEDNFITRALDVEKVKGFVNEIVQKRIIRSL